MKNRIMLVLVVLLLIGCKPSGQEEDRLFFGMRVSAPPRCTVIVEVGELRAQPDASSPVVDVVPDGTELPIVEEVGQYYRTASICLVDGYILKSQCRRNQP